MDNERKMTSVDKNVIEEMGFHAFVKDTKRTQFQKYQDINIGNRSFFFTLKYELLTSLLGPLNGITGLYFRQKFYRLILGKLGNGAIIGRCVTLRQPSGIFVGDNSILDEYSHLSVRNIPESKIIIGNNVLIGRHSTLKVRGGFIEIEDFVDIGEYCRIGTTGTIKIGCYTMIAAFSYIGATNHKFDNKDVPIVMQGIEKHGGVTIEKDVWIGTHVTITDGVYIGEGAIIGAHSLVNKDIPPYAIAYGIPAKVIRYR